MNLHNDDDNDDEISESTLAPLVVLSAMADADEISGLEYWEGKMPESNEFSTPMLIFWREHKYELSDADIKSFIRKVCQHKWRRIASFAMSVYYSGRAVVDPDLDDLDDPSQHFDTEKEYLWVRSGRVSKEEGKTVEEYNSILEQRNIPNPLQTSGRVSKDVGKTVQEYKNILEQRNIPIPLPRPTPVYDQMKAAGSESGSTKHYHYENTEEFRTECGLQVGVAYAIDPEEYDARTFIYYHKQTEQNEYEVVVTDPKGEKVELHPVENPDLFAWSFSEPQSDDPSDYEGWKIFIKRGEEIVLCLKRTAESWTQCQ